jgi:anti-sigma B factor antagonist
MQIEERVVEGVTILDLKGKMTLGEGDELLKDKINSLIQQDRKKLLLNLEGVPYIDSAGLGEIVRTTVSRRGEVGSEPDQRIRPLAIAKLLTVFETWSTPTPSKLRRLVAGNHRRAQDGATYNSDLPLDQRRSRPASGRWLISAVPPARPGG